MRLQLYPVKTQIVYCQDIRALDAATLSGLVLHLPGLHIRAAAGATARRPRVPQRLAAIETVSTKPA